jgi:hypothetical protein
MGSIVNCIQAMGIEVIPIPAGCTYLCQPIDMGINISIKNEMRDKQENGMIKGDKFVDGVAKEPSRKLVAE